MTVNWEEIEKTAIGWIINAGENIRNSLTDQLTILTKSNPNDLVTNKDKEIEKFFKKKIKEYFPTHFLLGEEGFGDKIEKVDGIVWVLDPIDGTMNFVHQKRNFAISLGVYENGVGMLGIIYDVLHNELYTAKKGQGAFFNNQPIPKLKPIKIEEAIIALNSIWLTPNKRLNHQKLSDLVQKVRGSRSYGSAALELAYVATQRLDAYITPRLSPWDYAAGKILIEEVGGVCSTLSGNPLTILENSSVLVCNESILNELLTEYIEEK
jgi:myo-inositol-1(or 4)-monophosphatase